MLEDPDKILYPKENFSILFLRIYGDHEKVIDLKNWCKENCEGYFCIERFTGRFIAPEPYSPIQNTNPAMVDIGCCQYIVMFEKEEDKTKFQLHFEG